MIFLLLYKTMDNYPPHLRDKIALAIQSISAPTYLYLKMTGADLVQYVIANHPVGEDVKQWREDIEAHNSAGLACQAPSDTQHIAACAALLAKFPPSVLQNKAVLNIIQRTIADFIQRGVPRNGPHGDPRNGEALKCVIQNQITAYYAARIKLINLDV